MKEFELIAHLKSLFKKNNDVKDLIVPIGDDCSVLAPPKGCFQVTTMDSLVEGNHFSLRFFSPREIGRKALRVNLSDLASMGASPPYYAWLALALSKDVDDKTIKGVLSGFKNDCMKFGVTLAGGNITSSAQFQLHCVLTGWARPNRILRRDGANPGDAIFVTGTIGPSTLAYKQFKRGLIPLPPLLKRWANPVPKIAIGRFLSERNIASSCIDISDGIFQDLGHIMESSGTGATVYWEKLPIDPSMKRLNPTPDMIGFGEDYELCFTVPQKKLHQLKPIEKEINEVGVIEKSGFRVLDKFGGTIDVSNVGYRHST